MHLLSVGLARSIWLFDVDELNPTGKNLFPDMMVWVGEKYSFQTFPKSIADVDKDSKGFLFKTGIFQAGDGPVAANFSFFTDGLVAETWASTDKSDAFLEDLLCSAATKFGLVYTPHTVRKRQYVSEVNVQLNKSLNNMNPKIGRFCEMLNGLFARHHLPQFEMTGMIFASDTSASSYKPPGLMVERKTGVPFAENRFWSKSPFTTAEHLKALEEFEKLLEQPFLTDSQ